MVSSKHTTKIIKSSRFTPAQVEAHIERKKLLLSQAFKIPPALNQFTITLEDAQCNSLFKSLQKYSPETKASKIERLKSSDPKSGPKPVLLKFGINHVVDLIEQKKAKFVVIAADVDPIEVVVYLPTLCKKMGIPYVIVKEKKRLGQLVNLKQAAVIALCDGVDMEMKRMGNAYLENYEEGMKHWGGGILLSQIEKDANVVE